MSVTELRKEMNFNDAIFKFQIRSDLKYRKNNDEIELKEIKHYTEFIAYSHEKKYNIS